MPKKEKLAKQAAFAMQKELDSEMTEEERAAKEKAGMGLYGGLNKGEDELFGAPNHAAANPAPARMARTVTCRACPALVAVLTCRSAGGAKR